MEDGEEEYLGCGVGIVGRIGTRVLQRHRNINKE